MGIYRYLQKGSSSHIGFEPMSPDSLRLDFTTEPLGRIDLSKKKGIWLVISRRDSRNLETIFCLQDLHFQTA